MYRLNLLSRNQKRPTRLSRMKTCPSRRPHLGRSRLRRCAGKPVSRPDSLRGPWNSFRGHHCWDLNAALGPHREATWMPVERGYDPLDRHTNHRERPRASSSHSTQCYSFAWRLTLLDIVRPAMYEHGQRPPLLISHVPSPEAPEALHLRANLDGNTRGFRVPALPCPPWLHPLRGCVPACDKSNRRVLNERDA